MFILLLQIHKVKSNTVAIFHTALKKKKTFSLCFNKSNTNHCHVINMIIKYSKLNACKVNKNYIETLVVIFATLGTVMHCKKIDLTDLILCG